MALHPKFAGQKLLAVTSQQPQHTLELYLDYVCPVSQRYGTYYTVVRMLNLIYSSPQSCSIRSTPRSCLYLQANTKQNCRLFFVSIFSLGIHRQRWFMRQVQPF
ncbi:uncharacterized protein BDW43DRAFT_286174 [Aspergillus alliaceus]|uniref:uncharacterized protein n=1 Tax=Petromyces alliaceus TaxID=209559 RepID=UPI0012A59B34|nr:uncharacterized protein BDW43DRAFT_286174 [Aspergillus alliaceus]KAB8230134.1 hypothetical protein BDW43DRAFT_286174 [Aspergillus alliaceus]